MTSAVRCALWDALARSPESFQFTRDGAERGAGDAGGGGGTYCCCRCRCRPRCAVSDPRRVSSSRTRTLPGGGACPLYARRSSLGLLGRRGWERLALRSLAVAVPELAVLQAAAPALPARESPSTSALGRPLGEPSRDFFLAAGISVGGWSIGERSLSRSARGLDRQGLRKSCKTSPLCP